MDDEDVLAFQNELREEALAKSSVARKISCIRSMYRFFLESVLVEENPAIGIKAEKPKNQSFEIMSHDEIELLLAQPNLSTPKGLRDRAMLEVLYATGMRVSEVCSLGLKDVNLKHSYIFCHTGGKERVIPIYPIAVDCLKNYIENARPTLLKGQTKNPVLFLNTGGEELSRQGFWKVLKRYATDAGIPANITPHTLRHSFATHLLENGADIHDLREILGHSDISSMHVYTKYLKEKMRTNYIKHHPRA